MHCEKGLSGLRALYVLLGLVCHEWNDKVAGLKALRTRIETAFVSRGDMDSEESNISEQGRIQKIQMETAGLVWEKHFPL